MSDAIEIREAVPADEAGWRRLWAGYNAFYEETVAPEVTDHTWRRIVDPASPLVGRVAVRAGQCVGFSVSVLHEGTWVISSVCYLEDLFVDPDCRGQGVGRALIEDLVGLAKSRGWSRLYWHTRAGNPARKLYDAFVEADDFVRYRLLF
jgi:GNAT superfamily N-acetyltransferase